MKPAFYIGASGLLACQERMNYIGNNLANVNTTGYKTGQTVFRDLVYTNMHVNTPNAPLQGSGVQSIDNGVNFIQGPVYSTNSLYDFAIIGDGLFCVEQNGAVCYTRDGNFSIGLNENGQGFLVTWDGSYVLDRNGNRIQLDLTDGANNVDFDQLKNQIGVFRFSNPNALQPLSGNKYAATERSGAAQPMAYEECHIEQSALEGSSTEISSAMADMIFTQRAYQVSARVVQTADENEQVINSLRK